jgi:hypothetical protein
MHALPRGTLALFSGLMSSWLTGINGIAMQDNAGDHLCFVVQHAEIWHCLTTPRQLS